jgi:hypothetical protein
MPRLRGGRREVKGLARILLIPFLIVLAPLLLPVLLLRWLARRIIEKRLTRQFRRRHGTAGRFVLLVYSDSPHWKARIESAVLPRLARHAVVLNWSRRSSGDWNRRSLEVRAFRFWGGRKEFNPLAVLFPPRGSPQTIRFWTPYLEHRRGNPEPLRRAESELFEKVEAIVAGREGHRQG